MVNPKRFTSPTTFIVLLYAGRIPVDLSVPFSAGKWLLVGDGKRIRLGGLEPIYEVVFGTVQRKVRMMPQSTRIFMRLPDLDS